MSAHLKQVVCVGALVSQRAHPTQPHQGAHLPGVVVLTHTAPACAFAQMSVLADSPAGMWVFLLGWMCVCAVMIKGCHSAMFTPYTNVLLDDPLSKSLHAGSPVVWLPDRTRENLGGGRRKEG